MRKKNKNIDRSELNFPYIRPDHVVKREFKVPQHHRATESNSEVKRYFINPEHLDSKTLPIQRQQANSEHLSEDGSEDSGEEPTVTTGPSKRC